jgi:non-specific serine/threonine protein kinase
MHLARCTLARGNTARAGELLREALGWLEPYHARVETAECLETMAEIEVRRRRAPRAATLLGAASALRDATGSKPPEDALLRIDRMAEQVRGELGLRAFTDAWSQGRTLGFSGMVAFARGDEAEGGPSGGANVALDTLTRREREVADLVAEGLTNRQIADRLGVTEATARTHVERILGKVGVHSRVQIATLVTERTTTVSTAPPLRRSPGRKRPKDT